MAQIHELLPKVAADVGVISKSQRNEHFRYNFRGIDDVLHALAPALKKHGVSVTVEVRDHKVIANDKAGKNVFHVSLLMCVMFHAPDGSHLESVVAAEGEDNSDKATAKAQSAAFKQACFLALCIPVTADSIEDADRSAGPTEKPAKAPAQTNGVAGEADSASVYSKAMSAVSNAHTPKDLDKFTKRIIAAATDGEISDVEFRTLEQAILERRNFLTPAGAAT